jgi:hypothetical protein
MRILMGILGLLLGLLMILVTLYGRMGMDLALSSDIPVELEDGIRIMQMLFYLVAALSLAVIVSSIATFINSAWAPKALLGSTGAMFVLLVGCGIYEYSMFDVFYGDTFTNSEEAKEYISWRITPMTTFSMLMVYINLFFSGLIWLIYYLGRGRGDAPAATYGG